MRPLTNTLRFFLITAVIAFAVVSCKKDSTDNSGDNNAPVQPQKMKFNKAQLAVKFAAVAKMLKDANLTMQTPAQYIIALKSAKLKGYNGSPDFQLFNESNVLNSEVFDFTNDTVRHNLGNDTTITEAYYSSIQIELYYLQMKLPIYSITRGVEWRNIRIYFTEDGAHRPGDVTQISDVGVELGWLFGNGVVPDVDPVTPRVAAYSIAGQGVQWLNFGGKDGFSYGPFGSVEFWDMAAQPFVQNVYFTFQSSSGQNVVMDFNVKDTWQFEDKTGDGYFGGDDLTFDANPTAWHMNFPNITIRLE